MGSRGLVKGASRGASEGASRGLERVGPLILEGGFKPLLKPPSEAPLKPP